MEMIGQAWIAFIFFWLFAMGCVIGSFLNVVIYRLPRGKSVFWPSSRCGACLTPIASTDNIPLLSYLRLHGRCRACGVGFSMRYFWIEFLTGVVFALLYAVEIGWNVHGLPIWREGGFWYLTWGGFAPSSWPYFAAHALLASMLLAATACVLDTGTVPRSLAMAGAVAGLCWSVLHPWPSPSRIEEAPAVGFVPWPVWEPLPTQGPLLGLLTGLAGLLIGPTLLRVVNACLGKRSFGPAGPALLLLSGGFLGWQPLVVALALAILFVQPITKVIPSLDRAFALALVIGLVIAWFGWRWIGPVSRLVFFTPLVVPTAVLLMLALVGVGRALSRR